MREKTVEETYQKKTPLEHILLRPDTYVGSIQIQRSTKWVLPPDDRKFQAREITFVPALYKIFDQVLVNAADNYQRDRKMNLLKVQISQHEGYVSVHNNGRGIPVTMHKEEKMYVPELIFGHLLTGSNYNDDQKKVVGGRNGYGAKLANIFSTQFTVECADGQNKKKFFMKWSRNMTMHTEAEISPYSGKDYTIVKFYPEFKRFGMSCFDSDIVALFKKRVFDMAGLLPSVKVFLNEAEISQNSFLKYVSLYFPTETEIPKVRDENVDNERWQVVVSLSEGEFKQVSFVNSICTSKGGTHVSYITDQIVDKIQEKLKKKDKNLVVKPFQIKAHLWVFVNCLIENPAFDSQTKETLTLKQSLFGSECSLSERMIKEILKTGIVDEIFDEAKAKELSKLAKITGGQKKSKLTGIPKLEDANEAGTRNSEKCTLILTQGDSAKSLAMAGIQVIGRDHYGVFPLKGKLLNVREANSKTLMANQEIQNLLKIIGLQISKKYEDLKSLRYGAIMIMSDQDTDGSHIKGLVINFIHHFWPSLFKINGFLKQFITPLLKVSKGSQCISFYTMHDFKTWAEHIPDIKTWKVKYYKGLGTSTDKQAMEYFQHLDRNRIDFRYQGERDDEAMDLIFSKKNAEKRKDWLSRYDPTAVMIYDRPHIYYKEFVDREFIHFSNEDNCRSIASIIDGFKPGQRKIIYSCFKRNLKEQIKVAQLAGYVSEHSAYHHGEMSLTMTIVNMAQSFVGSNNINLLMPNGQFGTRNQGGKDHASARYIFTNLNKVTRFIYLEADDHVLTYIEDDGQFVEPEFYMPIIPMVLVNGCQGIGSGWSTYIPNHCPRQIVSMLLKKIQDEEPFKDLKPWYKGFNGEINLKEDGNYEIKGRFEFDEQSSELIHVKELPIEKWTKDYKIFIDEVMTEGDTKITGLKEYHTKNRVHFELQLNSQFAREHHSQTAFWEKFLKLVTNMSMRNMVGFNRHKMLKKYESTREIMEDFYDIRLEFYGKRKAYLISKLEREVAILKNKERFIIEVVEERLIIRNVKRVSIVKLLKEKGFCRFCDFPAVKSTKIAPKAEKKEEESEEEDKGDAKEYNYLLTLPLWSLTFEKVEEIKKQQADKNKELIILENTRVKDMWSTDLKEFLNVLDKAEEQQEKERLKGQSKIKGDNKAKKAKKKREKTEDKKKEAKEKSNKKLDWDSESETDTKVEADKKANKLKSKSKGDKTPQPAKKAQKPQGKVAEKSQGKVGQKVVEGESLIDRVKRQMAQNKMTSAGTSVAIKPTSKKDLVDVYKAEEKFEVVHISKGKKSMQIDSESSEEWREE